ncbi:MAG: CpsD/CapB family tyrosine-protein kinase [Candidatus Dormibacterales bacterium]
MANEEGKPAFPPGYGQPRPAGDAAEPIEGMGQAAAKASAQLAAELQQVTAGSDPPSPAGKLLSAQFSQSVNEAMTLRQTLPGFADPRMERISGIELPPWFVDRCRRAYLAVPFDSAIECRVLGVTSASYGEGKTSVAIGMATAMAVDTKKPTLLIECDFATPSFYKFFNISATGGLSEWLEGHSRLRIVRGAALVPNIYVIPAGAQQRDPAHLFYQLADRKVFDGLRNTFGNVVVDLPPMLNISYAPLASALADRLLIVARSKATLIADLEALVARIGRDRVSGIVLNGTDYRTPGWLRSRL